MRNANGWGWIRDVGGCLTPRARAGLSRRRRAVGPFPSGAPELASMFSSSAPRRAGVDRCPRPRDPGDRPPLPEIPAATALPAARMRWAFRSASPESWSRRSSVTRLRVRRSPGAATPAPGPPPGARARPPGSRPCPRPAPSGPLSPLSAPRPFPRDKPGGRYSAWPSPRGSG